MTYFGDEAWELMGSTFLAFSTMKKSENIKKNSFPIRQVCFGLFMGISNNNQLNILNSDFPMNGL